jgi:hypothetical protein
MEVDDRYSAIVYGGTVTFSAAYLANCTPLEARPPNRAYGNALNSQESWCDEGAYFAVEPAPEGCSWLSGGLAKRQENCHWGHPHFPVPAG